MEGKNQSTSMKIFKGVIYFLIIILGAGLLAAVFAPGIKNVERTKTIDAPINVVFSQLENFKNWPNWDPWFSKDTLHERSYNGTVGDKVYGYAWNSANDDVGKGRMTMNSVSKGERVDYTFLIKNGSSEESRDVHFTLEENNGLTNVTWTLVSERGYPMKIINYFIDNMVGPDFEKGLSNLKEYCEANKENASENDRNVQIVSEYGINYAIVKAENLPMSEMDGFFSEAYQRIYTYVQTNGLAPKGPSRGLYYKWNESNSTTTLAAAVPISDILKSETKEIDLGFGTSRIGEDIISCKLGGGYSKSYEAHNALAKWIEENGKSMKSPVIEEYIKGPQDTQDTTQYLTTISYYFE